MADSFCRVLQALATKFSNHSGSAPTLPLHLFKLFWIKRRLLHLRLTSFLKKKHQYLRIQENGEQKKHTKILVS
jgi:hypothetical protein